MNGEEIKGGIYSIQDEATGEIEYDFDEIVDEFGNVIDFEISQGVLEAD